MHLVLIITQLIRAEAFNFLEGLNFFPLLSSCKREIGDFNIYNITLMNENFKNKYNFLVYINI
jgi:uncharacterized protein YbcV (DUF1398 family)